MSLRLVSLDLDGTLIHPAIFNAAAGPLGFGDKLAETTRLYFEGKMTGEETFHADYKHFVGRRVDAMLDALRTSDRWTPGIRNAVERLHERDLRVVVTTDQPDFLARITQELFGIDDVVSTHGEVVDGLVTGEHDGRFEKWPNLQRYLVEKGIEPDAVAHVGNGSNDVPIFERVALGIAVFAMSDAVRKAARVDLGSPKDFGEVADAVLARLQEA